MGDMEDGRGLVVVAEDEKAIADLERMYLEDAGFGVTVERDGAAALEAVRRMRPVLVVLDVGLPGTDGIEVCRALRAEGDWTPVIFVTARDDEVDRLRGLELGADDYLTKPFSPRELVVRVKGILRRQGAGVASVVQLGRIRLDRQTREVTVGGSPVRLTATEFALVDALICQPGRVFTRAQLLSSVWGRADYTAGRTVDVHIAQLRSKLGPDCPIQTVHGVGYRADG